MVARASDGRSDGRPPAAAAVSKCEVGAESREVAPSRLGHAQLYMISRRRRPSPPPRVRVSVLRPRAERPSSGLALIVDRSIRFIGFLIDLVLHRVWDSRGVGYGGGGVFWVGGHRLALEKRHGRYSRLFSRERPSSANHNAPSTNHENERKPGKDGNEMLVARRRASGPHGGPTHTHLPRTTCLGESRPRQLIERDRCGLLRPLQPL